MHDCLLAWAKMLHASAAHPLTTGCHARARLSQGSVPTLTPHSTLIWTRHCCCSTRIDRKALLLLLPPCIWLSQPIARSCSTGLLRVVAWYMALVVCDRRGQMLKVLGRWWHQHCLLLTLRINF